MAASITLVDALALSSFTMATFGVLAFIALRFVPAPYGRYLAQGGKSYSLGLPHLPAVTSWVLQECPSYFCTCAAWVFSPPSARTRGLSPNNVLLFILVAHYFNRSFVYPLRIVGGKPTPVGVFLMAFLFCVWNGAAQGLYLTRVATWGIGAADAAGALLSPRFASGVALCALGAWVNLEADGILLGLRKPGYTAYYIPRVRERAFLCCPVRPPPFFFTLPPPSHTPPPPPGRRF